MEKNTVVLARQIVAEQFPHGVWLNLLDHSYNKSLTDFELDVLFEYGRDDLLEQGFGEETHESRGLAAQDEAAKLRPVIEKAALANEVNTYELAQDVEFELIERDDNDLIDMLLSNTSEKVFEARGSVVSVGEEWQEFLFDRLFADFGIEMESPAELEGFEEEVQSYLLFECYPGDLYPLTDSGKVWVNALLLVTEGGKVEVAGKCNAEVSVSDIRIARHWGYDLIQQVPWGDPRT